MDVEPAPVHRNGAGRAGYDLIVHCGGCMLNDKEMQRRVKAAVDAGVPIVNYGVAIAKMNGILDWSLEPLK